MLSGDPGHTCRQEGFTVRVDDSEVPDLTMQGCPLCVLRFLECAFDAVRVEREHIPENRMVWNIQTDSGHIWFPDQEGLTLIDDSDEGHE